MKMEPIVGSETSAIINQTPGNYPKGNLLYSVHGESLKSGSFHLFTYSCIIWFHLLCRFILHNYAVISATVSCALCM